MTTTRISVVLDEELLAAINLAAKRMKQSRSAFVRDALREHLRQMKADA